MTEEKPPEATLKVTDLVAGYQDLTIVNGVTVAVRHNELVTVIGPNGAGKSTLLKAIAGLLPARQGSITLHTDGDVNPVELVGLTASQRTRAGIGFLPQIDNVFPNMTVLDNLKVGAYLRRRMLEETLSQTFEEFPFLYERRRQRAGTLSGGQRKTLALARMLAARPRLLLLDEPSAALSAAAADAMFEKLLELNARGLPMLVVEQNARRALGLSDYAFVLDMGRNRFEGSSRQLLEDDQVVNLYLGQKTAAHLQGPP